MQRKQQVGECWVCVIFFACVCVGASDSTTASDDPSSSVLCVVFRALFPGGRRYLCAAPRIFFGGWFLLFLAVF
jgi:hypothetical protein